MLRHSGLLTSTVYYENVFSKLLGRQIVEFSHETKPGPILFQIVSISIRNILETDGKKRLKYFSPANNFRTFVIRLTILSYLFQKLLETYINLKVINN